MIYNEFLKQEQSKNECISLLSALFVMFFFLDSLLYLCILSFNKIWLFLICLTLSVLSWTSVLDYIRNLKKSASNEEKKSLDNKNGKVVHCTPSQQSISCNKVCLNKTETAQQITELPKYEALSEIQLTTANLRETMI